MDQEDQEDFFHAQVLIPGVSTICPTHFPDNRPQDQAGRHVK